MYPAYQAYPAYPQIQMQRPQAPQPVPQPMSAPPPLAGRVVERIEDAGVEGVPPDGSRGWFPSSDGTCVWSRRWRTDGTVETVRFVPEPPPAPEPDKMDVVLAKLAGIEAALAGKEA